MHTVIISGPPGSGKGTQAKMIADHLGFVHISTGDILRQEIEAGTELGKLAQARIDDGNFVPDNIAMEMINGFIRNNKHLKGMVLDGFPRTKAQCIAFDDLIDKVEIESNLCISIDVHESELKNRLLQRKEHSNRPDDYSLAIIEHRLNLYKERTKPVTDYYLEKGNCKLVNGHGSVETVFEGIKQRLPKY
ncbi:MAG: adenylate kinase [Marinilabiliales bacterium]|nr:MAG: adenylate kinase [Marinilabiliales bacterium]